MGADSFSGFAGLVPGLSFTDSGPGNKRYALRGLQSAGEPEVALHYDEIPIRGIPGGSLDTGDSQPDLKLWDIDRIEALKGPQGTLYGNGSMGGAIRIISKRPIIGMFEAATEEAVGATEGGDPSWRTSGMVNLPLSPQLAIRLAGYHRDERGWIANIARSDIALNQPAVKDANWERTGGGRASFLFQPSSTWSLTGIAYYQLLKTGSSFETYPTFATADDRYVFKTYVRTPWRDESKVYNLISTHDLGWATLVGTGSYQERTADRALDTTRFLLGQFHCTEFTGNRTCFGPPIVPAASVWSESVEAWSGEARLSSKGAGRLQWTAGAFVQSSSTFRRDQVATTDASGFVQYDAAGNALGRFVRAHQCGQLRPMGGVRGGELPRAAKADGHAWWTMVPFERTDQQVLVQRFFPGNRSGRNRCSASATSPTLDGRAPAGSSPGSR